MAYTIENGCTACDNCRPQCPRGAIKAEATGEGYWIDPTLCDSCPDVEIPRCLDSCSIGAPTPLRSKKGRCKSTLLPAAILEIFLNGKTTPFASSMVVWEACNILSQQQDLAWETDATGELCYRRPVHRGRGEMRFRLATNPEDPSPTPMGKDEGKLALANFDIRAACIHLIFSAYITTLDRPWEDTFVINDQQIERYLRLEKRKDLTKLEKLRTIKCLVHQACQLLVAINWPRQGKVQGFSLPEHPVWHLLDTQYYFEEDAKGHRHLIGLGFTMRAGRWVQHFLNKQDYRRHKAFYQYGTLPQSLLTEVMSNWQQHKGAVRLLLWLLFKLRLGGDQRIKVSTLLRIAYGEARVLEATTVRGAHKPLLKTFEGDLEALHTYGLKPLFDPDTYPTDIQPWWTRAADIPDNPEEALEFWTNDANHDLSLTGAAPRDKWQRLLGARLLGFELSGVWQQTIRRATPKRRRTQKATPVQTSQLTSAAIKTARQSLKLSQRDLAHRLGKSQSWIRDIENGRFSPRNEDLERLRQVLNIS